MPHRKRPNSCQKCSADCEEKKQLVAKAEIMGLHLVAMDTQRKEAQEDLEAMTQAIKLALLSLKAGVIDIGIEELERELSKHD